MRGRSPRFYPVELLPYFWLAPSARIERATPCFVGKHSDPLSYEGKYLVGVIGFEPTTSCSQSKRATGLRHTPMVC